MNYQLLNTNDHLTQPSRLIPALLPENLSVDNRDIPDLLAFLHELAGQINYYDTEGQIAGDWGSFLESDTHLVIAILSRLDISALIKLYEQWRTGTGDARKPEEQQHLSEELWVLFKTLEKKISLFRHHFSGLSDNQGILREIERVLSDSVRELQDLLTLLGGIGKGKQQEPPEDAEKAIDALFSSIKARQLYLKTIAEEHLQSNELLSQAYPPHLGMLLNFLHLYTHLQEDLNGLTRKHLDFYYQQILGLSSLPAVPDQVAIFFEPDPSLKAPLRLEPGTQLTASIAGSEKPSFFALKDGVVISQTKIVSLKTICISDTPIGGGGIREARIYQGSYSRPEPSEFLKEGAPINSWPVLGEDQTELSEKERTMTDATIGLMIGSPLFYLPEGSRTVTLQFVFTAASFLNLASFIDQFPGAKENPKELIYAELLSDAFLIDYSAPDGWEPIRRYRLRPVGDSSLDYNKNHTLELSFGIDAGSKPFHTYKKEIHRGAYVYQTPLIRLFINNNAAHHAYSFFKGLQIERVNISTSAREVRSVKLQNNIGVLSPASPFQIFGPLPSVGSYLDLKNTNIFNRYTKDFSIRIEWLNLPRDENGFTGYYEGYSGGLRNEAFTVSLGSVAGSRVEPPVGQRQVFPLFSTAANDEGSIHLQGVTCLRSVDMKKIEFTNDLLLEKESGVQELIFKDGAIRLELLSPAEAFGHREYPDLLRHYASRAARKLRLPNQPFTPVVKSISLDYTLENSVPLSDNIAPGEDPGNTLTLLHQYPFGYDELYPENDQYAYPFMPQFGGLNHLYIGFKDVAPNQEISLLFQLEEKKFHHSAHSPATLTWSYLRENRWVVMDTKEILSDSTNNLIHSGILRLLVPSSIQPGNTILDPALCWLRASAAGGKSSLARAVAIYTHGVLAERILDPGEEDPGELRLPPGSIKDLKKRLPAIKSVWQLFPSFGGQPAETRQDYYVRVSERLRHKHRPLSVRDIEQFILKEFPGIYLVKCFGIGSQERLILPGINVQVIVIPKEKENGRFISDQPHVSLDVLFRIKEFLFRVLSPFVRIEVGNPVYERVKIACSVLFRNSDSSDYGLLLNRLHEDIRRYLCPWLYEEGTSMVIGGKIYITDILNAIRNLPYISYVTGFSVAHFFKVQDIYTGKYKAKLIDSSRQPVESICGSIPGAVLIPVQQHWINVLNHKGYISPPPFGIGNLSVGDEFFQSGQKGESVESPAARVASPPEDSRKEPEEKDQEEWAGGTTGSADDVLRPDPWQERFTLTINHHL
ncbi:MAG TPA: hypothetical protein VL832_05550 [Puia sp.]|nr:hypothetical protein [Puia sp.]